MLTKYKSSKTIQTSFGFEADSARIISNLKMLLQELDSRTEVVGNKIKYNQNFGDSPGKSAQGNTILPLQKGEIRLSWLDVDKIKLEWIIMLDSILWMTLLFGVIAGSLSFMFLDAKLVASVIIGAAAWFSVFIVWRQYTIVQMKDLIKTSCLM
ncbi:MAG TPA: hypothetical protein VGK38_14990 [Prolixibacteraceae bacterium]|jgi:hypothetical protein